MLRSAGTELPYNLELKEIGHQFLLSFLSVLLLSHEWVHFNLIELIVIKVVVDAANDDLIILLINQEVLWVEVQLQFHSQLLLEIVPDEEMLVEADSYQQAAKVSFDILNVHHVLLVICLFFKRFFFFEDGLDGGVEDFAIGKANGEVKLVGIDA